MKFPLSKKKNQHNSAAPRPVTPAQVQLVASTTLASLSEKNRQPRHVGQIIFLGELIGACSTDSVNRGAGRHLRLSCRHRPAQPTGQGEVKLKAAIAAERYTTSMLPTDPSVCSGRNPPDSSAQTRQKMPDGEHYTDRCRCMAAQSVNCTRLPLRASAKVQILQRMHHAGRCTAMQQTETHVQQMNHAATSKSKQQCQKVRGLQCFMRGKQHKVKKSQQGFSYPLLQATWRDGGKCTVRRCLLMDMLGILMMFGEFFGS